MCIYVFIYIIHAFVSFEIITCPTKHLEKWLNKYIFVYTCMHMNMAMYKYTNVYMLCF